MKNLQKLTGRKLTDKKLRKLTDKKLKKKLLVVIDYGRSSGKYPFVSKISKSMIFLKDYAKESGNYLLEVTQEENDYINRCYDSMVDIEVLFKYGMEMEEGSNRFFS